MEKARHRETQSHLNLPSSLVPNLRSKFIRKCQQTSQRQQEQLCGRRLGCEDLPQSTEGYSVWSQKDRWQGGEVHRHGVPPGGMKARPTEVKGLIRSSTSSKMSRGSSLTKRLNLYETIWKPSQMWLRDFSLMENNYLNLQKKVLESLFLNIAFKKILLYPKGTEFFL